MHQPTLLFKLTLGLATACLASGAWAAATVYNPMTLSVTYDAPPGSPEPTDFCFSTGTPFDFNAFNTVSLDLSYTSSGAQVEIDAAVQGGPTSAEHPQQVCFYFGDTPIAPGDTLNIVIEANDNVPADFDVEDSWWTFAEHRGQFLYPVRNPPPIGPVPVHNGLVVRRDGPWDPQDLVPFRIGDPDPLRVYRDDGSLITHTHLPEPGSLVWLALGALALSWRRGCGLPRHG